jgi:hypothetical protein
MNEIEKQKCIDSLEVEKKILNNLEQEEKKITQDIKSISKKFIESNFNTKYIQDYYYTKNDKFVISFFYNEVELSFSMKNNKAIISSTINKKNANVNSLNLFNEFYQILISDINIISKKMEVIELYFKEIIELNLKNHNRLIKFNIHLEKNITLNNKLLFNDFKNVLIPYKGSIEDLIKKLPKSAKYFSNDILGEESLQIDFLKLKKINNNIYFSRTNIFINNYKQKNQTYELMKSNSQILTKKEVLQEIQNAFFFKNEIITDISIFKGLNEQKTLTSSFVLNDDFYHYFSKELNQQKIYNF